MSLSVCGGELAARLPNGTARHHDPRTPDQTDPDLVDILQKFIRVAGQVREDRVREGHEDWEYMDREDRVRRNTRTGRTRTGRRGETAVGAGERAGQPPLSPSNRNSVMRISKPY